MGKLKKTQEQILKKLNISSLNKMQEEAITTINSSSEIILISPTGSGKTLAFLLPIIKNLTNANFIQVVIIVPTRELAIQIETVFREIGSGYKIVAVYGGHSGQKEKLELKTPPAVLVGTPGRIADHIRRERFSTEKINTLVIDEFDKSLEIGYEAEMIEVITNLHKLKNKILTSATKDVEIPKFINLKNPITINFSDNLTPKIAIKTVISTNKDKLETLVDLLSNIGNYPGIIFCNFKDTIQYISDYLFEKGINHGTFYGDMEQIDREHSLIKFRNGTHQLIIATDIAARGLDIPEIKYIIHYQLPNKEKEFIHRNGRTARMKRDGTAYILKWTGEKFPDYIKNNDNQLLKKAKLPSKTKWTTLYINGGRKDKISKADIVGLFLKEAKLNADELGLIELKQNSVYVAILKSKAKYIIEKFNNTRIKKKKVRISEI